MKDFNDKVRSLEKPLRSLSRRVVVQVEVIKRRGQCLEERLAGMLRA